MPTALLITRPASSGRTFADAVEARFPGAFSTCLSPLTAIVPEPPALSLEGVQALLFSSQNAVQVFAETWAARDVPALCVGGATATLAQSYGFSAEAAFGDVAALADMAAAAWRPEGGHYLYLRGRETAGDLAGSLFSQGIPVEEAILYSQVTLPLSEDAMTWLTMPGFVVAPVFSPASAERLAASIAAIGPDFAADIIAIAISDNAARPLSSIPLAALHVAEAPNAEAMLERVGAFVPV